LTCFSSSGTILTTGVCTIISHPTNATATHHSVFSGVICVQCERGGCGRRKIPGENTDGTDEMNASLVFRLRVWSVTSIDETAWSVRLYLTPCSVLYFSGRKVHMCGRGILTCFGSLLWIFWLLNGLFECHGWRHIK